MRAHMTKPSIVEKALLAAAVTVVLFGQLFFISGYAHLFHNTTSSMEPTLPRGSRMIVTRITSASRGNIVAFRYPVDRRFVYVKRVVAVGGDLGEIRDKVVFVNGKAIAEPYVTHGDFRVIPRNPLLPEPFRSRDQLAGYRVPPGHYFVLGDNRDFSSDSRYWGTIAESDLQGQIAFVLSWRHGVWKPR